jgi:glycine dehydrogenase subunit 1
MLEVIGVSTIAELFGDIPPQQQFPRLKLPEPLSELEVTKLLQEMADQNADLTRHPSFLGAGAYRHFVPAVVDHILRRGEFYTAYTPYQPEISQGTLTVIYEYQSLICQLTAMEVANASMYDGASALAEAALMSARLTKREKVVLSAAVHPEYRDVVRAYTQGIGLEIREVPYLDSLGTTDLDCVKALLDDQTACFAVQYPNFFGCIEDLKALSELVHKVGAMLVVVVDPIALGLLKAPGEFGADIVVGEGQPLGSAVSFGGPYLGFFATRMEHIRQMPGRLSGQTVDQQGRRGFVLTLQPREQHIRREKATSNICTNEALMALAATVYLTLMGKNGLRQVAELCYHKAHYAAKKIAALKGYSLPFKALFFQEFVVKTPQPPARINAKLWKRDIIGGYDLGRSYPDLKGHMLLCVTEVNTRDEIDGLIEALAKSV